MKLSVWLLSITFTQADFGDLCRCSCDESREELTILLPSSYACTTCIADTCRRHFIEQCKDAVQIVTECLNRTSFNYKATIWFYYVCLGFLGLLIILNERYPKLAEILKIDRKREDDFELVDLPLSSPDDDEGLQTAIVNLRRLDTEATPTTHGGTATPDTVSKGPTDLHTEPLSGDVWEPLIKRS